MRTSRWHAIFSSLRSDGLVGSFVGAVVMSIAAVFLLAASAPAQTLTWDQGNGSWDTTTSNWTGSNWVNGNTAVFGGTANSTISIDAAGISATGVTFNVTGDTISASSTNNLTLTSPGTITVGSGLTGTINAPLAGSSGLFVEGGGTLNLGGISTIDGGAISTLGLVVGATTANNTVNLSGSGTMGTISANRRSLYIGNSANGGNSVVISTPGSLTAPSFNASGNAAQVLIGTSSSNNSLTVSNGAYFAQTNGGGANTWILGANAGANSNSITITGTNSIVNLGSNQIIDVGKAGSSNSITVSNGGFIRSSRLGIGDGGGSNNYVSVIGTGTAGSATYSMTGTTNNLFEIGAGAGANGNYMSVSAGGLVSITGTGTSRNYSIGGKGQQNLQTAGGDSNYILVTGANSAFNLSAGLPLALGGTVTGAAPGTVTDGGNNNRIDIQSGGAMTLTGSLYVLGSTATGNTSVNLGNGSGISTLTVGANTSFTAGVLLSNANARLNIDSGRLVAGSSASLVSGPGQVVLNGPSYVSTAQNNSTISSLITGTGSFTLEGTGLLTLSNTSNSYLGNTTVSGGTLSLAAAFLADAATVTLASGTVLDLNYLGNDTIGNLVLNGVTQVAGTYGPVGSGGGGGVTETAYLTGTGLLNVTAVVPEPQTYVLLGAGVAVLGFLRRRRHA